MRLAQSVLGVTFTGDSEHQGEVGVVSGLGQLSPFNITGL